MRESIYIIFFSILFITAVRDNSLLSSMLLQIFLLIPIKDKIIKWFLGLYWKKLEAQNLKYTVVDSDYVTKGRVARVIIPKIFFDYKVGNKKFQGSFTYDSRFFTPYADSARGFFEQINKVELYYSPKNPHKYFVCRPINKEMLIESNIIKIFSIISFSILCYNTYLYFLKI